MIDILIGSDNKCRLKVRDQISSYNCGFLDPYTKQDSKVIDVLTYNKTTGDKYLDPIISDNNEDTIYLNIPEDGYITLTHIVLPTRKWVEENIVSKGTMKEDYYIYCIDGNTIYRYNHEGKFDKKEFKDIFLQENITKTTLFRVDKAYVSICFLKQCYINLCQQIFNGLCGLNNSKNKGCFSSNIDKDLQTRRDIVWMGINVIKYMVKFGMLEEAERIIELLEGCNGICSQNSSITNKSSGCGCSKT